MPSKKHDKEEKKTFNIFELRHIGKNKPSFWEK